MCGLHYFVLCDLCSVLKSLEFAGSAGDEPSSSSSVEDSGRTKSLETLLLEKNRVLQTENTQLKVSSAELNGKDIFKIVCRKKCPILLASYLLFSEKFYISLLVMACITCNSHG